MRWQPITMLHPGENTNIRKLKDFASQFGFNQCAYFSRPHSFRKLLEGHNGYNVGKNYDTPDDRCSRWLNHGEVFKVKGTTRVVAVGQNYGWGGFDEDLEGNVSKVITPLGLVAVMFDRTKSYYNPNNTSLHMIMTPETYHYYEDTILSDPTLICVLPEGTK